MKLKKVVLTAQFLVAAGCFSGCLYDGNKSTATSGPEKSISTPLGVPAEENVPLTTYDRAQEYYGNKYGNPTVFHNTNRRLVLTQRQVAGQPLRKVSVESEEIYNGNGSKSVAIKIWECTGTGTHVHVDCDVDLDYVLVGGGAWAEGADGLKQGALLTGSYPNAGFVTWSGESKDHGYTYSHTLHTYAVGMKLGSNTSEDLRTSGLMTIVTSLSGFDHHPEIRTGLPTGYTLIGGGAKVYLSSEPGNLLTKSYPYDYRSWYAGSKDHVYSSSNQIRAYAIGIREQHLQLLVDFKGVFWSDTAVNSATADYRIPATTGAVYLATCPGAVTIRPGDSYIQGRLLTAIIPHTRGATATDKAHIVAESGKVGVYAVRVGLQLP